MTLLLPSLSTGPHLLDALEDGLDEGPCGGRAAGHQGGAVQSALFAAGDAAAHEQQALALHIGGAAGGVGEVAVAAVDDDVTGIQNGQQLLDQVIHGAASYSFLPLSPETMILPHFPFL